MEEIEIINISLNQPLVRIDLKRGAKEISRFFTTENLIYMIDLYEKNTVIVDAKTGEQFKDYLVPSE